MRFKVHVNIQFDAEDAGDAALKVSDHFAAIAMKYAGIGEIDDDKAEALLKRLGQVGEIKIGPVP